MLAFTARARSVCDSRWARDNGGGNTFGITLCFGVFPGKLECYTAPWQVGHQNRLRSPSPLRRTAIGVPQRRHGRPARP